MSKFHTMLRIAFIAAIAVGLAAMTPSRGHSAAGAPLNQSQDPASETYGYKWIDNEGADDPASGGSGPDFAALWTDISASGTQLTALNCDDCITTISPPVMIRYYGQNWGTAPAGSGAQVVSASMVVSSNGNCQFLASGQNGSAGYVNESYPNGLPANGMNGMVAYLWDDGYGAGGGNARWQVVGQAPNRRLIVQYTGWDFCCSDGPNMEMQVQFTESDGGSDSSITFLYNDITAGDQREMGNSATIGIQSPALNSALNYSYNTASLEDGRAIRFYTNEPPFDPTALSQAADAGGPAKPVGFVSDATAYFRGTVTDPDSGNTVGLQVEVLPSTTPFSGSITGQTATTPVANMVASGGVAEVLYVFDGTPYGSGDYHWRVRAVDNGGGTSGWVVFDIASINFRVDLDPPTGTFPPYQPAEGSSVGVPPPVGDVGFTWGGANDIGPPGPLTYRIEVSNSAAFASTIKSEVVPGTSALLVLPISSDPLYWHVSAIDQAGNQGVWSTPIAFFVEFNDGKNHGGGDCVQGARGSTGSAIGLLLAFVIAAAAFRRI